MRKAAEERRLKTEMDVWRINQEIEDITERTQMRALSSEEQRARLVEKRKKIEEFYGPQTPMMDAERRKKVAEVNDKISEIDQRRMNEPYKSPSHSLPTDSLARVGNFLGTGGQAGITNIQQKSLAHLSSIDKGIQTFNQRMLRGGGTISDNVP